MYTIYNLDKPRHIRFGFKAFSLIEKTLKTKIGAIDFDSLGIYDQAVMLWAGLHHEDTSLTVDDVMDLVDKHSTIGEAIRKNGEALAEAFGTSGEQGKTVEATSSPSD